MVGLQQYFIVSSFSKNICVIKYSDLNFIIRIQLYFLANVYQLTYLQSFILHMAFKLSDEGIFSISKVLYTQFLSQKRLKKLDHDKLDQFKKLYIKPLYPHKETIYNGTKTIEKYDCGEYCCELNPGRFCCCSSTPPDSGYRQFGLGLCLYIKFLKHFTWFLFFMSLLSIVSIVIYQMVAFQTGYEVTDSYHNTLFSTTIGTLSSQFLKCSYSNIQTNAASFNLQCQIGQVSYMQPVFSNQTLSNLLNCRKQSIKMNQKVYMPSYTLTSITNSSLSNYAINVSVTSDAYEGYTYKHMAYNYQCKNSMYWFAGRGVSSQTIILVTVGIDLFIILCFVFFLISQHKAQDEEIHQFKVKQLAVNDFTIKASGFRLGFEEQDLGVFLTQADKLRKNFDPAWAKNGSSLMNNVVQVKIPEIDQIKEAMELRRQYYEDLYDLIDYCFFEDGIDLYRYKNAQDFIKKCYGNADSAQYIEYKERLTKLLDKFVSSKKVKFIDHEIQLSLLIVFTNPRDKKTLVKTAQRGCMGHYIKANGRKYYLSEPPVADMIIWQNKTKHTWLRVIIAWIITLGICLGSYLLVAFATFQKQVLLKNNKFNVGCGLFYTSAQLESFQQTLSTANKQIYLHCYCDYNYFTFSYKDSDMRTICSQWFSDFFVYSAIPILISFGIIVYNIIVDRIFRLLSKFESHDYLSTQLYSYIIKRSFMLIMNMGLIIILIKLNYNYQLKIDNLTFLFQGTYKDLTSDWYLQIGVIIILTLAFNIVIPIADMIFVSFVKCIRKCIDRQCYCVKTSQKTKKGYLELYVNDVFPIQSRYSDFIAMIIITLAFSAVMPVLYVIAFLSIWFMFVCDKLLLFRVYQKPINYSQDLQSKVFRIVYISIMIHCVVSPFVLSQKYLMSAGANIQNLNRFGIIMNTPYLIPYVVIFILLASWAVFHSTIVRAISYCAQKCNKDGSLILRNKMHQNFFSALNQYQITRLRMSLQLQIHNSVQHQKQSKSGSTLIKQICQNSLSKLKQVQRSLNMENTHGLNNIKLIGKAGYDEIFDDELFNRDKKIKSLDYQFQDIFKIQRSRRGNGNIQNTLAQINI